MHTVTNQHSQTHIPGDYTQLFDTVPAVSGEQRVEKYVANVGAKWILLAGRIYLVLSGSSTAGLSS